MKNFNRRSSLCHQTVIQRTALRWGLNPAPTLCKTQAHKCRGWKPLSHFAPKHMREVNDYRGRSWKPFHRHRPDITIMVVDWALKINDLSIYLSIYLPFSWGMDVHQQVVFHREQRVQVHIFFYRRDQVLKTEKGFEVFVCVCFLFLFVCGCCWFLMLLVFWWAYSFGAQIISCRKIIRKTNSFCYTIQLSQLNIHAYRKWSLLCLYHQTC